MEQKTEGYPKLKEVLLEPDYFLKPLVKLKSVYNSLDLGDFNDDVLKRITAEGTKSILSEYKSAITEEIDRSGIKSTRMRAIMLHGYDDAAIELNAAVEALNEAVEKRRRDKISEFNNKRSLTYKSCSFQKQYGWSDEPGRVFKKLTIGNQSWVLVEEGNRSWGLDYGTITMKPDMGDVHLYARLPRSTSENGQLEVHYESMPNTDTHYMVLILKKPYQEIDFNY